MYDGSRTAVGLICECRHRHEVAEPHDGNLLNLQLSVLTDGNTQTQPTCPAATEILVPPFTKPVFIYKKYFSWNMNL